MRIPINEATASQLADFATVHLALAGVQYRMGAERIRALIVESGYDKPFIEAETEEATEEPAVPADKRKKVRIKIATQEGPGGKSDVPIGCNGRVALIQRNVEVDVPVEYIGVLNDAKTVQFEEGPNGEPINPTEVPKHPFSIISYSG